MQTHIQNWGNSLGMRIPAKLAQQLGLTKGSIVDLAIEGDHLVMVPQRYYLQDLLEKISSANLHHSLLDSPAAGVEGW